MFECFDKIVLPFEHKVRLILTRVLYTANRNASSWAFRAWLTLKEVNISFEDKQIDIRRPKRWQYLAEIGEFSPPAAVPVLVEDNCVIFDSLAIMEYANEIAGGILLPSDIKLRAQARSFIAWQHSTFGRVCSALCFEAAFYPDKRKLSPDEKMQIEQVYTLWNKTIVANGGDYLFGGYSLADIMLLPSVIRFTSHYPVKELWPEVQAWVKTLLSRPYVNQWLEEALLEEPIYLPGYHHDP